MAFVDQLFIGTAGFLSIIIIWIFIRRFEKNKGVFNIFYVLSFSLITSLCALIVFYEWQILDNTFITIMVSLVPIAFSLGLVFQYFEKFKVIQAVFAIAGGLLIIATRIMMVSWWQYAIYTIVIISFLEILILPIIASTTRATPESPPQSYARRRCWPDPSGEFPKQSPRWTCPTRGVAHSPYPERTACPMHQTRWRSSPARMRSRFPARLYGESRRQRRPVPWRDPS